VGLTKAGVRALTYGGMETKRDRTELGHWLRVMRARQHPSMTQDEAAQAIGVSRDAMSRWESGYRCFPNYGQLVSIVRVFRELPPELARALRDAPDGTASG